jgi:hypothetical protein
VQICIVASSRCPIAGQAVRSFAERHCLLVRMVDEYESRYASLHVRPAA